ncbi:MAG: hypothetical protein Q9160_007797 [Pyrenula sp. 1 TL-2023]
MAYHLFQLSILWFSFVFLTLSPLLRNVSAATTSRVYPLGRSLHVRTNIDRHSCDGLDRQELVDELRRISIFADDAITAISPLNDGLNPEFDRLNQHDFERIFRLRASRHNRMRIFQAYQLIRDETYRPLNGRGWQGTGRSQITLECQPFEWRDHDDPCTPLNHGDPFFAISSGRPLNHLMLCPSFFAIDRHFPRNEVEQTRIMVLTEMLFEHFGNILAPGINVLTSRKAYQLARFATEARLRQEEWRWANPYIEPPSISENDRIMYSGSPDLDADDDAA